MKERILGSMVPWPGKNFIHVYLRRNPDLYGKHFNSFPIRGCQTFLCFKNFMPFYEFCLKKPNGHTNVSLIFVLSGPFWICTTLVFAIAISGNISNFLVRLGKPNYKYTPEFRKGMCCFSVLLFRSHASRLNVRGVFRKNFYLWICCVFQWP